VRRIIYALMALGTMAAAVFVFVTMYQSEKRSHGRMCDNNYNFVSCQDPEWLTVWMPATLYTLLFVVGGLFLVLLGSHLLVVVFKAIFGKSGSSWPNLKGW
jgi:hypothetical protein